MIETVTRKRIEILVDTPLVPRLLKHARDVDISGWSLIHVDAPNKSEVLGYGVK